MTILIADYMIAGLFSKAPIIKTIIFINMTELLISSKNISEIVLIIFSASSSSRPCFSIWLWLFKFFELFLFEICEDLSVFGYLYFRHNLFTTYNRRLTSISKMDSLKCSIFSTIASAIMAIIKVEKEGKSLITDKKLWL